MIIYFWCKYNLVCLMVWLNDTMKFFQDICVTRQERKGGICGMESEVSGLEGVLNSSSSSSS